MEYKVAFDPALAIDLAAFANSWNTDPATASLAQAHRVTSQSKDFSDLGLVNDLLTLSIGIGLGVGGNAIYDLIKTTLVKTGVRRRVTIVQIEHAGERILVIQAEEE